MRARIQGRAEAVKKGDGAQAGITTSVNHGPERSWVLEQ
jgi:hypothetical protein